MAPSNPLFITNLVQQRFPINWDSPGRSRRWLILRMRTWGKQLHTPDHPPRLVIVEPIFTRLEAGDDRMACCRRMLGRMLTRRTVTASDVPTLRAATEMKPPAFRRLQAFDTPITARLRSRVDSATVLVSFQLQFSFHT